MMGSYQSMVVTRHCCYRSHRGERNVLLNFHVISNKLIYSTGAELTKTFSDYTQQYISSKCLIVQLVAFLIR